MAFLDDLGLSHFWSKLKALFDNKQDKLVCHTDDYTPSQILAIMQAGQHVILTTASLYFQDVAYSSGNKNVYASCCAIYDGSYTIIYVVGNTSTNVWTIQFGNLQPITDKVSDIIANSASTSKYPNTKAVFDQFQRKPVVVYSNDTGLAALQTNIAESMNWQLTGLDLTPFKRIKIYSKGGQGSTNAGTTGAMILEMSLDPRMAITSKGGHYVGSVLSQKPNDSNRYASLTCAVSADKTSFAVLRQTSLYGTAATTNNDIGANVVMIEGYYD